MRRGAATDCSSPDSEPSLSQTRRNLGWQYNVRQYAPPCGQNELENSKVSGKPNGLCVFSHADWHKVVLRSWRTSWTGRKLKSRLGGHIKVRHPPTFFVGLIEPDTMSQFPAPYDGSASRNPRKTWIATVKSLSAVGIRIRCAHSKKSAMSKRPNEGMLSFLASAPRGAPWPPPRPPTVAAFGREIPK